VDSDGHFLTQREFPVMATLTATIEGDQLVLSKKHESTRIVVGTPVNETTMVDIWSDRCRAQLHDASADEWLSDQLATKCRLVYMPDTTRRFADSRYAKNKELTSFADTFPVSVISTASLADLNARLAAPVPMDRFRPNLVIDGCEPFAEDTLGTFTIGTIRFRSVKKIGRCVMVNIDQVTTDKSKEPLNTLASFRTANNKVYFGHCLLAENYGTVAVGDIINH
jgi:uncharacterized protein